MGNLSTKQESKEKSKLRPVPELKEHMSNRKVLLADVLGDELNSYVCHPQATYYPYNYKHEDKGWGCAWRAIQMVLSAYECPADFTDLFYTYSFKKRLLDIFSQKKQSQIQNSLIFEKLRDSKFAPEDAQGNWAEPFICSLICEDKKIPYQLFQINGHPSANAPEDVFPSKKLSFNEFIEMAKTNLKNSPIMIDDGQLAMTVLAYRQKSINEHILVFGDPHIKSNRENIRAGIYEITFDSLVDEKQKEQGLVNVQNSMTFENKKWMGMATEATAQQKE